MKNSYLIFIFILLLPACQKPSCPEPITIPEPRDEETKTINSWALKTNGTISGSLINVDFPTPTTGYISGINGVVYRTTDGGNTYEDISPLAGYDSYALDFVSEDIGYMVNNNSTVDGKVFKTVDGGDNWVELTNGLAPLLWRCIKFYNEDIGFAGGGVANYTQDAGGRLFRTIDGGEHWTEITSISNLKIIREIFFVNESVIFVSTDHARIYKSTDGGDTWTLTPHSINTSLNGVYLSPQALYFKNINEGYCLTNGTGIVGMGTFLMKTINGGDTWSEIPLPPSGYASYNYYVSLQFADDNTGYLTGGNFAEGKGSILKTIDGGNTWTSMGVDCPRLQRMHLVNDTLAYAVGLNATVLKSVP